jgi:hypothetical protein
MSEHYLIELNNALKSGNQANLSTSLIEVCEKVSHYYFLDFKYYNDINQNLWTDEYNKLLNDAIETKEDKSKLDSLYEKRSNGNQHLSFKEKYKLSHSCFFVIENTFGFCYFGDNILDDFIKTVLDDIESKFDGIYKVEHVPHLQKQRLIFENKIDSHGLNTTDLDTIVQQLNLFIKIEQNQNTLKNFVSNNINVNAIPYRLLDFKYYTKEWQQILYGLEIDKEKYPNINLVTQIRTVEKQIDEYLAFKEQYFITKSIFLNVNSTLVYAYLGETFFKEFTRQVFEKHYNIETLGGILIKKSIEEKEISF